MNVRENRGCRSGAQGPFNGPFCCPLLNNMFISEKSILLDLVETSDQMQRVQDKSETIEKCLESETGLEYYSTKVKTIIESGIAYTNNNICSITLQVF